MCNSQHPVHLAEETVFKLAGEVRKAGRFVATQRTEGISTSDIVLRILKDYQVSSSRAEDRILPPACSLIFVKAETSITRHSLLPFSSFCGLVYLQKYVLRNLERGYTRKDLGISFPMASRVEGNVPACACRCSSV